MDGVESGRLLYEIVQVPERRIARNLGESMESLLQVCAPDAIDGKCDYRFHLETPLVMDTRRVKTWATINAMPDSARLGIRHAWQERRQHPPRRRNAVASPIPVEGRKKLLAYVG